MTFDLLAKVFNSWDYQINPEEYDNFKAYFEEMLRRKRVMIIKEDYFVKAVLTYFLTDNWEEHLHKGLWEIKPDNPDGKQIFIDKMICQNWKLPIRRLLQEAIETNFNVLEGHYYHAPLGPHVKIKRRRPLNVQSRNTVGCGV